MKYLAGLFIILFSCQQPGLPDPLEAGWKGEKVCEVLFENNQKRILKCTFPPGVGHQKHYHKPHFAYTIQGSTFKITDENGVREVDLISGYNYNSNGVEWHEALNIGDSTAVFLIIEIK